MAYVIAGNIITPLGATTAANYQAVKGGQSSLQPHRRGRLEPFTASLLPIDGQESHFETMVVASARKAIAQAGIDVSRTDVVFILSTTKGDVELLTSDTADASSLYPGQSAQRIATLLGFTTQPIVVCNACISGLSAIILAQRLLNSHLYRHAVVCGCDSQSDFIVSGFQSLKALSPFACLPFDMERTGLNLGEAAATMVLAREAQAGAWHIDAGAIRNDAHHISTPSPKGEGLLRALKAVLPPDTADIAFVNAHGTATLFNDQMESMAIVRAGLADKPVNAYKGNFGHTMGAAGVMETLLSMAAVDDHTVLGTHGFGELGVSGRLRMSADNFSTTQRQFIKTLSGFGGCNAAIMASRATAPVIAVAAPIATTVAHSVRIAPNGLWIDGAEQPVAAKGAPMLTYIYKKRVADYPKYYKMDPLSRLGFLAAELLLQAEGAERFVECDDRAVVMVNRSSSIVSDRRYVATISTEADYFPSPAVFVYTLPNIVTGEIAIRNRYFGETSFYILPRRDAEMEHTLVDTAFSDAATNSVIGGWLDYEDDDHFEADLRLVFRVK